MKKSLLAQFFLLILLVSPMSFGADLQKGVTAYTNGDYATALREWTPLAEQGDADAQFNLGQMYFNGQGVLQDNIYAHMWFNIVASLGNDDSSGNRDIIAKRMTPADISAAQKLARECVCKNYIGC